MTARGLHMRCSLPGHTERVVRKDGTTNCLLCKRAGEETRKWKRTLHWYRMAVVTLGVEDVHYRLREAGIPIRRTR